MRAHSLNLGSLAALVFLSSSAAPVIGCQQTHSSHTGATSAVDPQTVELSPPVPPKDFRELEISPLAKAVDLISKLNTNGESLDSRRGLSILYKEAGYAGAARFFENTIRELRGESLKTAPIMNEIGWSMTERDLEARSLDVAMAVAELMKQDRLDEAVEMAKREIENQGPTVQVSVQWSHAVIGKATQAPQLVTAEALEVALRVFLTALEEKVTKPLGLELDTQASGYTDLAHAFYRIGDSVSCRTAARLAIYYRTVSKDYPRRGKLTVDLLEELVRKTGGRP